MKQALVIAAILLAAFLAVDALIGHRFAVAVGLAAVSVIAVFNSITFMWLWHVRATPLALGMALSWTAAGTIWWYLGGMPFRPDWLHQDGVFFAFLALFIVGGGLHVAVIHRSAETRATLLVWPAILASALLAGFMTLN